MSKNPFRFSTYSVSELRKCGAAFTERFEKDDSTDTTDWTKKVADWLRLTKAPNTCAFGKPQEFILDQCHAPLCVSKHPRQMKCSEWEQVICGDCTLLLGMECEWGKKAEPLDNVSKILHDAWKLASVRARCKIMIFASQDGTDRPQIVDRLRRLRKNAGDTAPWLWVDVPWNHSKKAVRSIKAGLLNERGKKRSG